VTVFEISTRLDIISLGSL